MTRSKAASTPVTSTPSKPSRRSERLAIDRADAPPSSKRRSDATGHLDRAYASELRQLGQERAVRDAVPFFAKSYTEDAFAEQLGEHAVEAATSGENSGPTLDDDRPEDAMSPFQIATDALPPGEEEEEED